MMKIEEILENLFEQGYVLSNNKKSSNFYRIHEIKYQIEDGKITFTWDGCILPLTFPFKYSKKTLYIMEYYGFSSIFNLVFHSEEEVVVGDYVPEVMGEWSCVTGTCKEKLSKGCYRINNKAILWHGEKVIGCFDDIIFLMHGDEKGVIYSNRDHICYYSIQENKSAIVYSYTEELSEHGERIFTGDSFMIGKKEFILSELF